MNERREHIIRSVWLIAALLSIGLLIFIFTTIVQILEVQTAAQLPTASKAIFHGFWNWLAHRPYRAPMLLLMDVLIFLGLLYIGVRYNVLVRKHDQPVREQRIDQLALNKLKEGVLILDAAGIIRQYNRAFVRILHLEPPGKIEGKEYTEILDKTDPIYTILHRALEEGKFMDGSEVEYARRGIRRVMEVSTMLTQATEAEVQRFVLILRDLTETVRLRSKLKRRDRLALLGQITSGMTHEIRNPLGAMDVNIQLLWERLSVILDERQMVETSRYLEIIRMELSRLNMFVENLIQFSKQKKLELSWVSMDELLDELITFVSPDAREHHCTIRKHYFPALPPVYCDRSQIRQVFLNIITNAFHFMENEGVLEISTEYHVRGDVVIIGFRDNGPGISSQNLEQVFDLYYSTRSQGTGMGLTIAYRIVSDHGGTIEVESREGEGSTFFVELPVVGPLRESEGCG